MPKASLYDPQTFDSIVHRLEQITPASQRAWGTMTVAQMLAHLRKAMETAFDNGRPRKTSWVAFFLGPLIKRMVMRNQPYRRNLPTGPQAIVKDDRNFAAEKAKLLDTLHQFKANGPEKAAAQAHPMFGRMTGEEWGFSQWKHFDHHLKQFGA